ncbi:MAG: HDOD domain-containing protein [Phycisphaerales bacterium]|nr:HDOD domain-containing protein [Phycisphaerales bacterium]
MVSVNDILKAGDRLAAMPTTVMRVSAMIAAGKADGREIERILKSDDVLAAAVLRRANSVAYGGAARTFDLRESIVRLGSRNLMHVIMEQKSAEALGSGGSAFGLRRGALWRSAVGGAVGAELIARRAAPELAELAYVAGLLRDIGKVAIEAFFGDDYIRLLAPHSSADRTFVQCERAALGFDHAEVGAAMVVAWGLPDLLCNAVRRHHEPPPPDQPGHDMLADIVHAADAVCLWAGLAVGHDGLAYTVAPHVRQRLGLTRHEAEIEIAQVWTAVREIEQSLNAPAVQEKSA